MIADIKTRHPLCTLFYHCKSTKIVKDSTSLRLTWYCYCSSSTQSALNYICIYITITPQKNTSIFSKRSSQSTRTVHKCTFENGYQEISTVISSTNKLFLEITNRKHCSVWNKISNESFYLILWRLFENIEVFFWGVIVMYIHI